MINMANMVLKMALLTILDKRLEVTFISEMPMRFTRNISEMLRHLKINLSRMALMFMEPFWVIHMAQSIKRNRQNQRTLKSL